MTENYNDKISIILHKDNLSKNEFKDIVELIKNENEDSILAKLDTDIIKNYLEIAIKSENIFLFSCQIKNKIIGYALFAKKPMYLISEFSKIKFKILFDLIKRVQIFQIINILFSILTIDLILLSKDKKDLIKNSLNLNLLAINKDFQSKGLGKFFSETIIKNIYDNYFKFELISVETSSINACNFYTEKLKFKYIGKKIRLFKIFFVFLKK